MIIEATSRFKLKQAQAEFIGACEQFVAYIGAIGTGKSTALISKAIFHCQETPGNLGVIVRKQFSDLRNSTIRDFETYTGVKVNESTHEAKLPNGSSILFIHGDVLDSLKNINCGFFGIEQAEEFPDSTTWDFLVMRLRRQCKFRSGFLIANANGHNWIWKKFIKDGCPSNHKLVEAVTSDFADILPPDYLVNLKQTLPDRLYRRYVLNSHDEMAGLVYDEYHEEKHMVQPFDIPNTWERGFVLDHGFRNPTAVLWYAIDFDGNIILYDEHYQAEQTVSYHAGRIKERGILEGYCDPSVLNRTQGGDHLHSIADEYLDFGITLMPSSRSDEVASIARVNEFFKAGKIKVVSTIKNFREEIAGWKWKEPTVRQKEMNLPEEPEDRANHLMDCLKYLISSRFPASEKPQEKPGRYSMDWFDARDEYLKQRQRMKRRAA